MLPDLNMAEFSLDAELRLSAFFESIDCKFESKSHFSKATGSCCCVGR